jgi:hypothetical protein
MFAVSQGVDPAIGNLGECQIRQNLFHSSRLDVTRDLKSIQKKCLYTNIRRKLLGHRFNTLKKNEFVEGNVCFCSETLQANEESCRLANFKSFEKTDRKESPLFITR